MNLARAVTRRKQRSCMSLEMTGQRIPLPFMASWKTSNRFSTTSI